MIRYLIDSSALWRVLRDAKLRDTWRDVISEGAVGSCAVQRTEFRRSARNFAEYEQFNDMFDVLYPLVPTPKGCWQWVESAQYRLLRTGTHRALSSVDLVVAAAAAHHGLVVLHDDNDFTAAARHLTDLRARRVQDLP